MPNRILREGILTSERVSLLDWPAEVFYRRLMSVVDDFGRYYAKPELLRAACYPLCLDKVGNSDIGKWLLATEKAALVRTYAVDGKQYLEMLDFRQQVRAKDSKFPPPATQVHSTCIADAQQMPASAHLDGDVFGDEGGKPARKRAPTKVPLPDDFTISDGVRAWAESRGISNLTAHFENFVETCRAKGYTYADWDAAFRKAVTADWAKIGNGSTQRQVAI